MFQSKKAAAFKNWVNNKFHIYNSLFLNLPYRSVNNIGMLLPILNHECKQGLDAGKNPQEILEGFFASYAKLETEKDQIDFMFRVVQYVERQIVLFDSVEDAAFPKLKAIKTSLSIRDYFQHSGIGKSWDAIAEKLSTFSARIVFTAHPTQFYTPAVLDIIRNLRQQILDNNIDEIDLSLQQLGLTSLVNSKKPTPLDEAKNIIYFLRNVYYDAIGELYAYVKENVRHTHFDNPNIIKLGFWPGGDRDGNPFVTAETTQNVADELRLNLMKCYYKELKRLQQKLTFRKVDDILSALREDLYATMFNAEKIISYEHIIGRLSQAREILVDNFHSLYLNELDQFMDKVRIFKTHFATLDIRQDHSGHLKAITAILTKEGLIKEQLEELSREQLTDILLHKNINAASHEYEGSLVADTVKNIAQLKKIQQKNGEEGCNRYIISNSEDPLAVLFVYALFRWCGWGEMPIPFDIIPLFETMEGMRSAENTMKTLFEIPEYRQHMRQRNDRQTIMLGFSDGTKDGGYLKANWSIFKTKESLSGLCAKYGIKAIFFDGRGGPPARGGGKTHRFYAAQSPQIANNEIQLTIQGQTITSTYGTEDQFIHNCEQLVTAGLANDFFGEKNTISEHSRALLEELGSLSFEKYDALKKHKMFIPYLENKSTLKYYGKANIGSRPGKRGHKKELTLSDLRAISFVGSWSQLKQNVPGYFGLGTAIQTLKNQGRINEIKTLYREVPFFKALILNSMMSMSKCYFELTSYMKADQDYHAFWNILHAEYQLSKEMLLEIAGFKILMEEEPVSRESIKVREKIVLPLLVIQQYALQKISLHPENEVLYEKIVTRSLYGNINASRNSA